MYIEEVFRVMVEADWHEYQLLTKRADRLRSFSHALDRELIVHDHIWLGVSVEDRKYGLSRIEALRQARAGKRFLSIEPLLEDLGTLDLRGIDWVIVGGESGRGARPMHVDWVRPYARGGWRPITRRRSCWRCFAGLKPGCP